MAERMSIILFSGELDKALAAFTLAISGASAGMEVGIFFTFWGLTIIKKRGKTGRARSLLLQKILAVLNRGIPVSRLNMFGLGGWMMRRLLKKKGMASLEEMITTAKKLGVRFVACTTSCGMMGITRDSLREDVDDMAGAAVYISMAKDSRINLFI